MLSYLSKISGIGGTIKNAPEDFLVEEIAPDGSIYEFDKPISHPDKPGPYVHFVLQKKNWTTSSAISEIADRLHISEKNFNIAGSKDRMSVSTQIASVRGASKEALLSLKIKDISINGAWGADDRVHLGDLLGNRFTIIVRGASDGAEETAARVASELNKKIPNYFGEQRFGSTRKNTHLIGQKLLKGEIEEALLMFLCDSEGEENQQAKLARKELYETRDFSKALKYYPKHLRLERSLIAYLDKNPNKSADALRRLPRNILLLFIHAFQSDMFNRLLSDRISEMSSGSGGGIELEEGEYFCGETLGFPDINKMEGEGWISGKLIGYTSPLNKREKTLLEELGIEKEAFKLKELPEIASKGSYRTLLAPLRDFGVSDSGSGVLSFRFALQSGSYATVAMREFMDPAKE